MATMEESDNATALKKAYAEKILNTAKESAVSVMISDRKAARLHHDLCGTKEESLCLHARLKQMIDAKTIEAEIKSSNQQRQIDVLEAQLQEAEDIIVDLRSELRWVRDELEKAWKVQNVVVNKERETVCVQKVVVVGSVNPNQDKSESDSLLNQSSLLDDECGGGKETISAQKKIDDLEVVVGSVNINQDKSESDSLLNQSSLLDDECGGGKETISAAEVVVSLRPDQDDAVMNDSLLNQGSLFDDECGGGKETISAAEVVTSLHPDQEDAIMSDSLVYQSSLLDDECGGGKENISAAEVVASLRSDQHDAVMSDSLLNQSSLFDDGCGGNDEKQFDGLSVETSKACESELDSGIRRDSFKNQSSLHDDECGGRETISVAEVVASLRPDQDDAVMSDSHLNQSSLFDDGCGGNGEKQFDGLSVETSKACESELDADIRSKKLELSRNGCTQRIHALETKTSSANEDERHTADKDSEKKLTSGHETGSTRSLVLALRASNAEVIPLKPSNSLGIKKSRKSKGRRKTRRWGKRKATLVRSQSQLTEPYQSHSDIPCSKTSVENSCKGSMDTHLSVENDLVDAILKSRKEDALIKCGGEENSVVPTTKMGPVLVDLCSDLKAPAVVSDQIISEYWRANRDRLLKYTYQRKRKRVL